MKKHLGIFTMLIGIVIAIIILIALTSLVSPSSSGFVGVLIIFASIYSVTFLSSMIVVDFVQIVARAIHPVLSSNSLSVDKSKAARRKTVVVVAVLNFVPIFLISMNSIGQLSILSVVLLLAIEGIVIFYLLRNFN